MMDLFNLKRVEELEKENEKLEKENAKLIEELARLHTRIDDMLKTEDSTPKDCLRGEYCKACEFGKMYHYTEWYGLGSYEHIGYLCGKGQSCQHFVERDRKE